MGPPAEEGERGRQGEGETETRTDYDYDHERESGGADSRRVTVKAAQARPGIPAPTAFEDALFFALVIALVIVIVIVIGLSR